MTPTLRIAISDDEKDIRDYLREVLPRLGHQVVSVAENGYQLVEQARTLHPDLVIADVKMPGMDGITAIRQIRQKYPTVKIIALTSFAEPNIVQGALQAGAIGYLQKNVTAKELVRAIHCACEGKMTLSSEATQVLAYAVAQPQMDSGRLTERERDVLKCMLDGLTNKEIAAQLVVSLGTVKFHVSNIFQKLGVDSRVEAVKLAIEQKLV